MREFLESGNLKFVKKFSISQESIPVKNISKMLLPTDPLKHYLFITAKVSESGGRGRAYPKNIFFIPLNLSNRYWTLPFVSLKTKTLYILDQLTQHTNADLANKASSKISFLRKNFVTQKDLQLEVFKKYFKKGLS